MPYVKLPDGTTVHVRMATPRRRRCVGAEGGHACPTAATLQCDFPWVPARPVTRGFAAPTASASGLTSTIVQPMPASRPASSLRW